MDVVAKHAGLSVLSDVSAAKPATSRARAMSGTRIARSWLVASQAAGTGRGGNFSHSADASALSRLGRTGTPAEVFAVVIADSGRTGCPRSRAGSAAAAAQPAAEPGSDRPGADGGPARFRSHPRRWE